MIMETTSTNISSPVTSAVATIAAAVGSITMQDVSAGVSISVGILGILAGVHSLLIGREKYLAMKARRKFDEVRCQKKCENPVCPISGCKVADALFQRTKDAD